jgi:enoyl-CoA hydratase
VGKGVALQLLLTGEMISAQEAHRVGLVNEVVPPGELLGRAEAIARQILANAPIAVRYCMEAVQRGMETGLSEGLFLEATLFAVCCATQDQREGTSAFLEKRSPRFRGE